MRDLVLDHAQRVVDAADGTGWHDLAQLAAVHAQLDVIRYGRFEPCDTAVLVGPPGVLDRILSPR